MMDLPSGSALSALLRVSEERRRTPLSEIEGGSIPTAVYYVLLGASELIGSAIREMEELFRSRLGQPALRLVRSVTSTDVTSKGQILFGGAHFGALSEADARLQASIETAVRGELATVPATVVVTVDAIPAGDHWQVRAAVVGARTATPAEVRSVAQRVEHLTGRKVELSIWMRSDVLVTAAGMMPLGEQGTGGSG